LCAIIPIYKLLVLFINGGAFCQGVIVQRVLSGGLCLGDCTAIYGLTLFLELKDINNLNICLKIINKLIKESKNKNKVVLSLKKLIVVYQIG
jgi:hypothetical protein